MPVIDYLVDFPEGFDITLNYPYRTQSGLTLIMNNSIAFFCRVQNLHLT